MPCAASGREQENLALQRTFKVTERSALQFRAEGFNVFNHSNFGDPGSQSDGANHINSPNFGLSTQVLSNSLGTGGADGGLNPPIPDWRTAVSSAGTQPSILSDEHRPTLPHS